MVNNSIECGIDCSSGVLVAVLAASGGVEATMLLELLLAVFIGEGGEAVESGEDGEPAGEPPRERLLSCCGGDVDGDE